MSFHHLAITTRDMPATHAFYSEAMGFRLAKVIKQTMPRSWAKHFFYDTGNGQLMAFWELHDERLDDERSISISKGLGLPSWSNHIAFGAESVDDLHAKRDRLLDCGHEVTEIDHGWCHSIYVTDPNDILVEFCVTTHEFAEADDRVALRAVTEDDIPEGPPADVIQHMPAD